MDTEKVINKLIEVNSELARIKDLDLLLDKILYNARKIVNADAGSVYIKIKDNLSFNTAQNETLVKRLEKGKKLVFSTFKIPINNTTISGYVANNKKILIIDDAYSIPATAPYNFGKKYDEISNYRTKSILTIPLLNHLKKVIGVLQIINSKDSSGKIVSFSQENLPILEFFANSAAIAIERAQMTREMILRMIKMAELRDPKETGAHVNRVAGYSIEIYEKWAQHQKVAKDKVEKYKDMLRLSAMLHDVGKIGISDTILKKPAKFTPEEFAIMKQHTLIGARLFQNSNSDFELLASEIALNHHEKWNGKGYPGKVDINNTDIENTGEGKKREEIPISARIVALADVFDALSSARIYKKEWDEEKVLDLIRKESGEHFDPEVVDCFFEVYDQIKAVANRYKSKGE